MEERFLQQLKKGVLEMLVLEMICERPSYGYELLSQLKTRSDGLFTLREGTLYPILYRLEDDGMICSAWQQEQQGRGAPKKVYTASEKGLAAHEQQTQVWKSFVRTVDHFQQGGTET